MLDSAAADHPGDPDIARARGILYLDGAAVLGVSGIGEANNSPPAALTVRKRTLPVAAQAQAAIHEIEGRATGWSRQENF